MLSKKGHRPLTFNILQESNEKPETVTGAPHTQPVRRLDEVRAARELDLAWSSPAS